MICHGCYRLTADSLCRSCRFDLRPAGDGVLQDGLRLIAAFEHTGVAAALMHELKYRGVSWYADLVAEVLAPRIPALPLVPVPRSLSRFSRYGVDPSYEISRRIAHINGVPVLQALRRPVHTTRRAGGDHDVPPMVMSPRRLPRCPVLVVDDVVTSGRTIDAAVQALGADGVVAAVAANRAAQRSTLAPDVR